MSKYIDADALSEKFHKMGLGENSLIEKLFADGVYAIIDTFPTADVEPVRHGKWIMDKKWGTAICSECKFEIEDDYFWRTGDFRPWEGCPICRAKMDGKETTDADTV